LAASFTERLRVAAAKGDDLLRARASIGAKHPAEFRAWLDERNAASPPPEVPGDVDQAAEQFDELVASRMRKAINMGQCPDRRQVQQALGAANPELFRAWNQRNTTRAVSSRA